MKKTVLMTTLALLGGAASAAPGFLYKVFTGSAYNGTGDIWSSSEIKSSAEMAYARSNGSYYQNTTFGYASYMYIHCGDTYKFRAAWDDFASVKIGDDMVIPRTSQCGHSYGEFKANKSGWYKLEIRVSNGAGGYGDNGNMGEFCGVHYSLDGGMSWKNFAVPSNGQSSMFVTSVPVNNEIFAPYVLESSIRESDPTILDVRYVAFSKKPTVKVRVLAFEDGVRSFAKVVRPVAFVDGTEANVGDGIAANVEHKISWRVSSDWKTKLAKLKFEVLASEGELLPLELMTIPASDQYGKMKISWNAITERQWFDALLWLYADKTEGLTCAGGILKNRTTQLASGTGISTMNAVNYVYGKMGYSILTGAPLTYANAETRLGLSPSGARQYAYKVVGD